MNSSFIPPIPIDFDHLLRLRLVVGRAGEADQQGWWNTQSVLGEVGASLYRRGFPRTHPWTRARVVFEVARQRCLERFPNPKATTLWNLPAEVEDAFDHRWAHWLDSTAEWSSFFQELQTMPNRPLIESLRLFDLWDPNLDKNLAALHDYSATAVQICTLTPLTNPTLTLLAGGFSLSKGGSLVVPWLECGAKS